MPKITVYITAYNYGRFVKKSIESVVNQTEQDWELIVINDGSTDDTKKIISEYEKNKKIRIINQENKGLNITNNIALRLSKGDYIMRLDADDYLDKNALEIMCLTLEKKKNWV